MFRRHTRVPWQWLGLFALGPPILLAGCGPQKARLVPVEGKVTVGGKPLATDANTTGWVILYPDKAKGNQSLEEPRGPIDSEGRYTISTGTRPGASPGWYKVSVDAAKVIDPKNPYHSASGFLIPERYIDKEKSKLALEVVEDAPTGKYDLALQTR
jgi:hypothetical protein